MIDSIKTNIFDWEYWIKYDIIIWPGNLWILKIYLIYNQLWIIEKIKIWINIYRIGVDWMELQ